MKKLITAILVSSVLGIPAMADVSDAELVKQCATMAIDETITAQDIPYTVLLYNMGVSNGICATITVLRDRLTEEEIEQIMLNAKQIVRGIGQ